MIRNIASEAREPPPVEKGFSQAIPGGDKPVCACADELRCGCGSLLARMVDGAVELKCRRCKRVWRVAVTDPEDRPEAGGHSPPSTAARRWRLAEGRPR